MRVLPDECLSQRVAEQWRRRGYDVVSVIELGRREVADAEQLEFAAAEHRTFVTYNVDDFVALVAE
jgi:predicted nuclease of predicted toxin-antitoxin system